jgi:hypothetical protein
MSLQEIDGTLTRLRAAADAIGANLLEIELDPNRGLLDSGMLEGDSATRWGEASTTLAQLWQWHAQLDQLLDRAGGLRGSRARLPQKRLEELRELLQGDSIELSSEHLPLGQRNLLVGARAALRCTPEELLERSSAAFDEAKTVLAAAASAWDELLPRLHLAHTRLKEITELGQALGERVPPELDRARERMSSLTETLSKDPLSVDAHEVLELEQTLEAFRVDLESLERLRRELEGQLADARKLLVELRRVAQEGAEAHQQALVKISAPAVREPLGLDRALETQLEDVEKIARHGAWRQARTVFDQWVARATSLLEQARLIASENRAPIQTRNELRGLLDACQAKATRLGLIEDPRCSNVFERAQASLYTAPTDLAEATELVHCYRRTLAHSAPHREVLR